VTPKGIKLTMENKFYISSLKEAAKNTMFQNHWMPVETWAELINHYYKPALSLVCNSTKLLNAVTHTKWFNTAIETTGVIDDELSLYRNRYHPKGGKQIYCFYAAPKGVKPTINEKQRHTYIDYSYDLLNRKITRLNVPTPPPCNLLSLHLSSDLMKY
jgi:hypothetical protein